MHSPTVVIGSAAEGIKIQYNHFTARHHNIAIAGKAADPVTRAIGQGIVKIYILIGGKVGMKCYTDQTAFTTGVYTQLKKGSREQRTIFDNA